MSLALGVVAVIAVVWGGIRLFGGDSTPEPMAQVAGENAGTSGGERASPPTSAAQGPSPELSASATVPGSAKAPANSKATATARASTHANAKLPTNPKAALSGKLSGKSTVPGAATSGSSAAISEFIPDVPQRARRTIRGNVKVSVRVIVEQDGTVFAALSEHRGPSRYFERMAVDAAKKWTFPPANNDAQRLMLVRFAFNREGTTAEAVALN